MWEVKKNVTMENISEEDRKFLIEMGMPENFNFSESFSTFLLNENIDLNLSETLNDLEYDPNLYSEANYEGYHRLISYESSKLVNIMRDKRESFSFDLGIKKRQNFSFEKCLRSGCVC